MITKKGGIFIGFLFLVILFLGIISAESCDIRLRTECQESPWNNILMGLSNSTNAHGELFTEEYYEYVLCCDFTRTKDCGVGGTNKIIGLSDVTNAHAEIPDAASPEYIENDVCYGNFSCRSGNIICNYGEAGIPDEMAILSLSDLVNAHIGGFNDYATKICCSGICEAGEEYLEGNCVEIPGVYWANQDKQYIEEIYVDIGTTTVLMIFEESGLDLGIEVTFEIYEKDWYGGDEIRVGGEAIIGIVDADGTAIANWTILESDLEKGINGFGDLDNDYNDLEFYFKINDKTSNDLSLTIVECALVNYCGDYGETECNSDACNKASLGLEGINCDDPFIECGCMWNSNKSECSSYWKIIGEFYCGHCGDSMVNLSWETCDDGEHLDNDGCSYGCHLEGLTGEYCGDGVVNLDWEECDDGNDNNKDNCSSECKNNTPDGAGGWYYCGDGIQNQDWEECDDDNNGWNADLCSPTCQIQEISCDDIEMPSGGGTCLINEITDDDCEDGFITYSWEGTWTGEQEGADYDTCIAGGERTVPCPAEIQLPFFGIYNFIITFMLIGLIYVFVIFRQKH